jgi:chromosome segregation ATPase
MSSKSDLEAEVSRLRAALVQAERSSQIAASTSSSSSAINNNRAGSLPSGGGDATSSADLQVKLAAAFTKISSLEREVDTKQRLVEDAHAETERVRDSTERVVAELVAKNQQLASDLRRVSDEHEREIAEVLRAHEATVAELTDCRRQLAMLREAQSTATAQIATGAAINRELAEECDAHKQRRHAAEAALHETQRALEELRLSEADARADVDDLLHKIERADSHLVQLTEEATAASVTASRLKAHAQQLQSERDALQRRQDELVARIKTPSIALTDLIRSLMRDVDAALRDAQNVMEKGNSNSNMNSKNNNNNNHRSSTPSWFEHGENNNNSTYDAVPRLWPANAEGQLDDASCIVLALQRASEVIPVLTDDIAAVRRSIGEALRREGDEAQQLHVLRDALSAERAHVAELADAARTAAEQGRRHEDEIAKLNAALHDSAQWMAEAAQIGEERARRAEHLALTIRGLENERNQLLTEVTRVRDELQHAKLLNEVSSGSLAGANLLSQISSQQNHNYISGGSGGGGGIGGGGYEHQHHLSSSSSNYNNNNNNYYSPSSNVRNLANSANPYLSRDLNSNSNNNNQNQNFSRTAPNNNNPSWETTFAAAKQTVASKQQQQQPPLHRR